MTGAEREPDALMEAMARSLCGEGHDPCDDHMADARVLLAGPVGDALRQARAEALREAAGDIANAGSWLRPGGVVEYLRVRADREEQGPACGLMFTDEGDHCSLAPNHEGGCW